MNNSYLTHPWRVHTWHNRDAFICDTTHSYQTRLVSNSYPLSMNLYICIYVYVYMNGYMYSYIYRYTHICIYIWIYKYICVYNINWWYIMALRVHSSVLRAWIFSWLKLTTDESVLYWQQAGPSVRGWHEFGVCGAHILSRASCPCVSSWVGSRCKGSRSGAQTTWPPFGPQAEPVPDPAPRRERERAPLPTLVGPMYTSMKSPDYSCAVPSNILNMYAGADIA